MVAARPMTRPTRKSLSANGADIVVLGVLAVLAVLVIKGLLDWFGRRAGNRNCARPCGNVRIANIIRGAAFRQQGERLRLHHEMGLAGPQPTGFACCRKAGMDASRSPQISRDWSCPCPALPTSTAATCRGATPW